ncbi:MAG: N-acetyltransferase [Chloroflexi bacterium]|nr:N-acetyltransferase [Chloroflexota bacterium]
MDVPKLEILDHPEATRYEAVEDGSLAGFIEYRLVGSRRILVHTEVLPEFEGRGIAAALARHVLEAARAVGGRVTVKCPFIAAYVRRHPEYDAITSQPRRG